MSKSIVHVVVRPPVKIEDIDICKRAIANNDRILALSCMMDIIGEMSSEEKFYDFLKDGGISKIEWENIISKE